MYSHAGKKKNMKNNLLVKLSVFSILIIGGLLLSFMCLDETNMTSFLAYHDGGVYKNYTPGPLIFNQTIRGEFRAVYDNLGMVKLRIQTFNRINTTHITFEIREKGNPTPLATNAYTTDRFTDGLLYPFGFPVVTHSKDKIYEFTVTSPDGIPDNAIGIAEGYHDIATQYVFQKVKIFSRLENISSFFSEKIKSIMSDPYMILYVSMFLVPACVYLLPRHGKILAMYSLLIYTYIPLSMYSNTILVLAMLMYGIAIFTRIAASRIYLVALIWLVQIPCMIAFGNILAADRAATLIFFYICIGGIISVAELRKQ